MTLSGRGDGCLNLKSEWGLSQAPSLQNKTNLRSKAPPANKSPGHKRGGQRKDPEKQGRSQGDENPLPQTKRKKVEEPEKGAEAPKDPGP